MSSLVKSLTVNEDGATAVEYGLIAGLIAMAILAAITTLGTDLSGLFNGLAADVVSATPSS
jgi:pilus assembly protein Flp/PilA